MKAPMLKMNNGYEMPALGLGTNKSIGVEGIQAIKDAIDAGYRHFDTAYVYGNESEVGQAIRDKIAEGVVTREEIFVVTKLWCTYHEPSRVEAACRKSLTNLNLDYIDLYIMHFPVGFVYHSDDLNWPKNPDGTQETNDVDYVDTWKAMENLVKLGLVRSIGLSNFNSEQIERVLSVAEIKPVNNQVECSPFLNQKKLIKFCKDRDIIVVGYSPLGRPNVSLKTPAFMFDEKVLAIAAKYNKSAGQIVLRYLVENGAVPIPKSVTKSRIIDNINIFDFQLTDDEKAVMDSYDSGFRLVKLSDAKHAKYWPFEIEY